MQADSSQRITGSGEVNATTSAFNGATELGIDNMTRIRTVILALSTANIYKCIPRHADHHVAQDVYRKRQPPRIRCT
ncbi:type II toxin-antitoxin system MqsR family toxin [Xylella taiwanensis]|uniref:Type II toxin-antitoxin system MqsR family toxin n=2 Tax=Xylella taiwanensis TaxID=1444770 RepID=A0ABS8TTU1_9GAMM|nr:type II toxin-antitoxin system MqsR family toxin [Xylella taiwanensis]MCD8457068.1 type II toxin-antitoxin system MqsR family toxin [Xylella taiwanensis]MCD8459478.1 type II toxin-antitoxin system MqsR family toxin [Xylella taiwanensis]MCD8461653.1 type II toxin-antitoxin system MqsR family toxin [Xylella taiwanensis]MCD8462319.1 type II toxin-antitoxin system MqsR family toxin [Xylella taiwanensis]MCD8466102.1 type II toxin-antitoxin system MqsR family toxin [Xylella taiwanensis]